jgi:hypothetical protein
VTDRDWFGWHGQYDVPGSTLARRLAAVQDRVAAVFDGAPPGPLQAVSICAGQGRDLLGVLATHGRRADVSALLVELDSRNVTIARKHAFDAGLSHIEVVADDASLTDVYEGRIPADLVLACGVFGNVTDEDIARTISFLPAFCKRGGSVIWTRHRRKPDLVPTVCRWFADHEFRLVWLSDLQEGFGVGVHRFQGRPGPLARGERIFTFVGRQSLERRPTET